MSDSIEMAHGSAVLLLARSALTAAPLAEMERLRALASARSEGASVVFAFSEQGLPSLREVVDALIAGGCRQLRILPLLLPAEPNFLAWLSKTLRRWRDADPRPWPSIAVAPLVGEAAAEPMLELLMRAEAATLDLGTAKSVREGSIVPAQKRRVLVCMGGPCHAAGAAVVWQHLRAEQERLGLRTAGEGTMSAKTTCLGPCNLAPVLQVWPEGTYYGGVDEAVVDRIVDAHLLGGQVLETHAYSPTGKKAFLRERS